MVRNMFRSPHIQPHLVRIEEASDMTGLPESFLRKTFMREEKRPKNIPPPPPHKRIGRAIYIIADGLSGWIDSLDKLPTEQDKPKRGRPTVAERIARREKTD